MAMGALQPPAYKKHQQKAFIKKKKNHTNKTLSIMDYNRDAYRAFPTLNSIDSMAAHSWQVIKLTTLSTNYGYNAIVLPSSEPAQCS